MFVTKSQLFIFLACVGFGGVSAIVFNLSFVLKLFFKNRIVKIIIDIMLSLPIGFAFVQYSFVMNFPSVRFYMLVGIFIGIYLYFKSFYIIVANLCEKFYNICKENI